MSYGFQVWNPSGVIQIDTSTSLTRLVAFVQFTMAANGPVEQSFTIPGMIDTDDLHITSSNPYFNLKTRSGESITITRLVTGSLDTYNAQAFRLI